MALTVVRECVPAVSSALRHLVLFRFVLSSALCCGAGPFPSALTLGADPGSWCNSGIWHFFPFNFVLLILFSLDLSTIEKEKRILKIICYKFCTTQKGRLRQALQHSFYGLYT